MFPYEEYKELCELFNVTALSLDNPDIFAHYNKLCELHKQTYAKDVKEGSNDKKLTWSEYVKLAIRTESIPLNSYGAIPGEANWDNNLKTARDATRLLHAALGICTELAELADGSTTVNLVEEIGDVYWYLAIADDVLGFEKDHYFDGVPTKSAMFYLGELQDVIKRHIFYGKELDRDRISKACNAIAWHLYDDVIKHSLTVDDCWEANIIKLEKRYPDKFFDSKFAIHRDTDRELDHIAHDGSLLVKQETLLDLDSEIGTLLSGDPIDIVLTVPTPSKGQAEMLTTMAHYVTPEGFNRVVAETLTAARIEKLAMDLCFEVATKLRSKNCGAEAHAYDMLGRDFSGKGCRLTDYTLYSMWERLGYSFDIDTLKEMLKRKWT